MSIVRKDADRIVESKKMFGGEGEAEFHRILNGADEMFGKGRLFNHAILRKNCEIGWHVHHGDGECYYILKGQALYNDNGTQITMYPGDMSFVGDGEGHSIKNCGDEDLEIIALILYT